MLYVVRLQTLAELGKTSKAAGLGAGAKRKLPEQRRHPPKSGGERRAKSRRLLAKRPASARSPGPKLARSEEKQVVLPTGHQHELLVDGDRVTCSVCFRATMLKHRSVLASDKNCFGRFKSKRHAQARSSAIRKKSGLEREAYMFACCKGRFGADARCTDNI